MAKQTPPKGTIVAAWHDAEQAHIAMAVEETQIVDGEQVVRRVEYLASLALRGRTDVAGERLPDLADMDEAAQLEVLESAVKAQHQAQIVPARRAIAF